MSATANDARRAEWRLHELDVDMMLALEEANGEFTPEVQAIEDHLAMSTDELARHGVKLQAHAEDQIDAHAKEACRVAAGKRYWEKMHGLATRWIRVAAAQKGGPFEVGTRRVRTQKKPARLKRDGWEPRKDGWVDDESVQSTYWAGLVDRGLAKWGARPDSRAILAELKKGAEVPGFLLEYPTERTVVVK